MVTLNIDRDDCKNIADFLEIYFFQNIRDDDGIDNMDYVRSMVRSIDELRRAAEEPMDILHESDLATH